MGTRPGKTPTYNGVKGELVGGNKSIRTMGGYSAANTVHEDFVIKVPHGMDLKNTAPLVCAGITMYSPLKYWGAAGKEKMTVGIIGIGVHCRMRDKRSLFSSPVFKYLIFLCSF